MSVEIYTILAHEEPNRRMHSMKADRNLVPSSTSVTIGFCYHINGIGGVMLELNHDGERLFSPSSEINLSCDWLCVRTRLKNLSETKESHVSTC
jgi:hypothetical protein